MNWYEHKAINLSWLTEQLYGNRNTSNTGKLGHKLHGRRKWQEWELTRLEAIRQQLITQLATEKS